MSARKALGKGIAALIPEAPADRGAKVFSLPLDDIIPSPRQPRREMDSRSISELAESIRQSGVLQPVLVRRTSSGFELVAGERRWRAARQAGLPEIPVVVRDLEDAEALLISLIENVQREDLNPIEEAQGYDQLAAEFNYSQEEIARIVGKDRATVTNSLRLLKLPEEIKQEIRQGNLSAGHGRALLALEGGAAQREIARAISSRGLSVRATEDLIRRRKTPPPRPASSLTPLEAQIRRVVERIKRELGLKVEIKSRRKSGGKMIIHYSSEEELTRIVDKILDLNGEGRSENG